MSAQGLQFARKSGRSRRRHIGLAVMVLLAAVWLGAASRVHVNASWSDGAWGYAAFPLFGEAPKSATGCCSILPRPSVPGFPT